MTLAPMVDDAGVAAVIAAAAEADPGASGR